MMEEPVYILDGARTPFASFGGSLSGLSATELGVVAAREALIRAGVEASEVDNVVFGCVIQADEGAAYLARHVGLRVGVPEAVPALTVNRLCGSGLQAVVSAAQEILVGDSELALVGGAESMSRAPYLLRGVRFGLRMGDGCAVDMLSEILTDRHSGLVMGMTAENLARRYQISRQAQDEFALLSHQRAASAQRSGRLREEIAPVVIQERKGERVVETDEHIRPDTSLASLARLRPAFAADGTVTAGNASGINDGACALLVASENAVRRRGLTAKARIVSWAVVGVDPAHMGIGPVPAIRRALAKAGLTVEDIDLWEVNEAFAAQYLSVERELALPRERTNVNGGAIALGHPVGASGARLLLTLVYELQRRNLRYGAASLCIGGGQGIAMVVEAV
jgi:acetyl-CoA acyltransferase 2